MKETFVLKTPIESETRAKGFVKKHLNMWECRTVQISIKASFTSFCDGLGKHQINLQRFRMFRDAKVKFMSR